MRVGRGAAAPRCAGGSVLLAAHTPLLFGAIFAVSFARHQPHVLLQPPKHVLAPQPHPRGQVAGPGAPWPCPCGAGDAPGARAPGEGFWAGGLDKLLSPVCRGRGVRELGMYQGSPTTCTAREANSSSSIWAPWTEVPELVLAARRPQSRGCISPVLAGSCFCPVNSGPVLS